MKRYLRGGVFAILLIFIGVLGYQYMNKQLPNEKGYLAQDRQEQWCKDIEYLKVTLPKVHKNLYFEQSEAYFIEALDELKEKISSYTDVEINMALAEIVSSMGDTHTGINIGVEETYPIKLYWYDEGIYIVDAIKEYEDLLYSRIVSLNGRPIEEVAKSFKPFFRGANEQWFKHQVMYYITSKDLLKYLGIIETDEIELEIEKNDSTLEKIKMLPFVEENFEFIEDENIYQMPFYKQHPYENYWCEYLPEEKIMYVNYNVCREMYELPFTIFTDEVFKAIKENDVQKLVIDLRENTGGSDKVFKPFLKKLEKSPLNEEGKLYVVMGRKTYSSGLNTVINIKNKTHAILVGESSGGIPNHYGDTRVFELPNSKLRVRYSTKYIKKMEMDLESMMPDVTIGVSGKLELQGRDAVLEWIIKQ